MRQLLILIVLTILSLGSPSLVLSTELADSQIIGAMDDVNRIQSQFSGNTTPPDSAVYRALKLLKLTRDRLDSSKNQTHESWKLADTRLKNLVKTLQSKLAHKGKSRAASRTSAPSNKKSTTSPNTLTHNSTTKQATMISLDRARIKKLARDIASATDSLDQGGPKPFQDPEYVGKYDGVSQRYHESLETYLPFAHDPDVQQATAELEKMDGMILFGKEQAASALQELGNVQARLAKFQTQMSARRPPPAPIVPYTSEAITNWIEQAKSVRSKAISDFHQLKTIQEKAWLPLTRGTVEEGAAFDRQDVIRLLSGLQRDVKTLDDTLKQLEANLLVQVNAIRSTIEWFDGLDPENVEARENSFLGQGRETEALERLDSELQVAEAVIRFDTLLKRNTLAERQALRDTIQNAKTRYRAQRAKALELIRMPKPASANPELVAIAQETLAKPSYGTGKIIRLVINSDKVTREKETSEIEIDEVDVRISGDLKLSGTQTPTLYEWEQFQVATAEPVGDTYFIFYNTLKYFTAGATTTPLNRWVLSERIQSSEIPKENIALE